ncbi:MAG: hypothetical protein EBT79_07700 [Actinobacteria bacterium]|nr:hypothetical protein [Actinomycetota bacterium]
MALSKEVEVILRADARSARAAILQIERAASRQADSAAGRAIKSELEDYANKLGNTAATLVSTALESSSRGFRTSLTDTVNKAAVGIGHSIRAAMAESDPQLAAEKLREVKKQMAAFEQLANKDIQKALSMGLKDVFSGENVRDFGGYAVNSFEKALNGMDPNDLGGFAKALVGSLGKGAGGLAKMAKGKEAAAMAAGDTGTAAAMGEAAAALGATATALAGVAAVLAVFVAWMKAADDYQAKLNKTLLEGASVSDVLGSTYFGAAKQTASLTEVMNDAREASLETAIQFKMTTDETARVLQELNSAGITYKRIIEGATTAAARQAKFAEAINQTITYSSMLGVSVSELAGYQNTLMKDVNISLDRTFDVFQAISDATAASGMETKTFFTAISQATSGMALYNVRIGQAIGLVKSFSKIVGEADASKVLGEMTEKKGVDERLRITTTAIEAVGLKKVQDLFRRTTAAGVEEFQKSFAGEFGSQILEIFKAKGQGALGEGLISSDTAKQAKAVEALARLPDETREALKAAMENIADGAASRSFGAFALSAKGMTGGVDEIAGVMNKLDMAGKLLMLDYQASILEKSGDATLESATSKATLQKFMEALGLDEDQLEPLLRYRQYAAAVGRVRLPGAETPVDKQMLEAAGFTVEGDKVMKGDKEIKNLADVIYGMGVNMESAEAAQERRDATEKQRMQGTITDALNDWVQGKLFENALADQGLLGSILKYISKGEFDPEKTAADREKRSRDVDEAMSRAEKAKADLAAARTKAGGQDTPDVTEAEKAYSEASYAAAQAQVRATLGGGVSVRSEGLLASYSKTEYGHGEGAGLTSAYTSVETAYKDAYKEYQKAYTAAMMKPGVGAHDPDPKQDPAVVAAKKKMDEAGGNLAAMAKALTGTDMTPTIGNEGVKLTPTPVQDAFISKDGSMYRGPSADNILMFKDGGPLDPRTGGGGGGGNVVININGGDQAMVYRTVARAIRATQA